MRIRPKYLYTISVKECDSNPWVLSIPFGCLLGLSDLLTKSSSRVSFLVVCYSDPGRRTVESVVFVGTEHSSRFSGVDIFRSSTQSINGSREVKILRYSNRRIKRNRRRLSSHTYGVRFLWVPCLSVCDLNFQGNFSFERIMQSIV